MRIATWNINSVTARLDRLTDWLQTAQPDVVALQELKCTTEAFPAMPIQALGYEAVARPVEGTILTVARAAADAAALRIQEGAGDAAAAARAALPMGPCGSCGHPDGPGSCAVH